MKVPFVDLSQETEIVRAAYLAEVDAFLQRNHFVLSPEVERFERDWAAYVGTKHAVGVSSGADALYLALRVIGVGPGNEVITQGNAYNASVTAILRTGATPRFADIDSSALTIDPQAVRALINKHTRALMPVHLYGRSADMDALRGIAEENELAIVEDCSQAHGAAWNGRKLGSWGVAGCFSFYPTKNLGAFGDAGAITTDDPHLCQRLCMLRNLGMSAKNVHDQLGYNMRLDPIQAIAVSLKLPHLDSWNAARAAAAARYGELIAASGLPLQPQVVDFRGRHVQHLFVVQLPEGTNREQVCRRLEAEGVGTAVHYPVPVYRQPFYRGPADPCPLTDLNCARILSLPLFPAIDPEQQRHVVEALERSLR